MNDPQGATRRGSLETVRSALVGLTLVGALGIVGAIVSYRADVNEARRSVRERLGRQGRLYAESLSLHLEVLEAELKRVADHLGTTGAEPDPEVLRLAYHDRGMFGGGIALLSLEGNVLWSAPDDLLVPVEGVTSKAWFQKILAMDGEGVALDALGANHPRLVVGVTVKAELHSLLVGVLDVSDRFLFSSVEKGEQRLVLGADLRVLLPSDPPRWATGDLFESRIRRLLQEGNGGELIIEGESIFAFPVKVPNTGLTVVFLESEELAIAPIRARLIPQLVFLAVLQVTTLTLLSLYLRRIWRIFLQFETRVAQQEKMAALGAASSLIAHEVKNSLNGLNAAASLVESGGDTRLSVKTLKGQIDRLGHLASSLLSFSKPTDARTLVLRLDQVAGEAVEGLAVLPEYSEVKLHLELAFPIEVRGDPLLLLTAIDNLIRNAIEAAVAAKDLGKITEPTVWVRARLEADAAVLTIIDNAGGPPPNFEDRLYEPFFTTKAKGIGLGLSMARRAVEQQGGVLHFERGLEGSQFTIRLPKASSAVRSPDAVGHLARR